jgi:hypothetical protein
VARRCRSPPPSITLTRTTSSRGFSKVQGSGILRGSKSVGVAVLHWRPLSAFWYAARRFTSQSERRGSSGASRDTRV